MQQTLSKINSALIKGCDVALITAIESVPLDQLLSQDNIAQIRARDKKNLVLLLSTLAVSNDVSPARAQVWLDCYHSISSKTLAANILRMSEYNILRLVINSLIKNKELKHEDLIKYKGDNQHWCDAFELAIDNKAWSTAVVLLEILLKTNIENILWLQLAKRLSQRHILFMDESGIPIAGVNYFLLGRLYELCMEGGKAANVPDMVASLAHLRARCLEMDGHFSQAISLLQKFNQGKKLIASKLSIARNFCRMGDLPRSIKTLDSVLAEFYDFGNAKFDDFDLNSVIGANLKPESSFEVDVASKALADLACVFNEIDLKFFLVSGTLLGYEREGKLLDHDKDIDVGVVGWKNQYEICFALLNSNKFTMSPHFLKGNESYYIPIQHNATGYSIDIFIYFEEGDKWITGVDFFFGYRQKFAFTPFKLKPINFLGVSMWVPDNTDLNLTENFGSWREPDASYISHLESPSTINKGGLEHLLTARLHAIGAIFKRKPKKLRKVVEVLRLHSTQPCAMSEHLLISLMDISDNIEGNLIEGMQMENKLTEIISS